MQKNVRDFCNSVKERFPEKFKNAAVLDAGSCDINGNNRYLFQWGDYVGIDISEGQNVDVICPVHRYYPGWPFDVIISTEAFEHDMFLAKSLKHIVGSLLEQGGLFLFTCATTGCREHGTLKSHPELSPTSQINDKWANYYQNVTEEMVRDAIDIDATFKEYEFSIEEKEHSLQFWGIKKKGE